MFPLSQTDVVALSRLLPYIDLSFPPCTSAPPLINTSPPSTYHLRYRPTASSHFHFLYYSPESQPFRVCSMTQIVSPPNELLAPTVGHLRDRRVDFFDPVATKVLQSVRLVCRRVSFSWLCVEDIMAHSPVKTLAIATPMLFENML